MAYDILIADDHSIVRSGIKSLIKNQLVVNHLDEAASEPEIIHHVKLSYYNLIILDINIPGSDFSNLMDWLRVTTPRTAILIFTMHTEDIFGRRSFQLGAKGYLHKTAINPEIILAIRKILEGGVYLSDALERLLSYPEEDDSMFNPFNKLSTRELEIAMLINKGKSLPQICSDLNIQYSTANTYKRRIFEKLSVYNTLTLSRLMSSFNIEG